MGDFTKAVFGSKEFFTKDVMKQFESCDSQRSRLQFVNKNIPGHVTEFLRIEESCIASDNDSSSGKQLHKLVKSSALPHTIMVPHPRFPTLSQGVCVEYQKERGRYIVANKKIKRGEIVAVESPIIAFPVLSDCEDYCNCCYKSLTQAAVQPVSCDTCQQVFWCSTSCKTRATNTHHRYECQVRFPVLMKQGHPGIGKLFMIFRIFTQKSLNYFREHSTLFLDHNPSTGSGADDQLTSSYTTLFNLARHTPTDPAKLLEISIVSIVFVRMLTAVGYFHHSSQQGHQVLTGDQEMVAELMSVLVPVTNVNTHPVHDCLSDQQSKTVAAAVYPVSAALFNHSCDPSLVRATWADKLVLAAGRDIAVGEELTDMYTVHWTEYSTEERKEYLERVFHFTCCCPACQENWEPEEDDSTDKQNLKVQKRLAAHNLRSQTEHRLLYFISNKLD